MSGLMELADLVGRRKSRACKSESDLYASTSFKSYENITQTNYIQMVNSMINGAISEVADPEYVEYVRRHLQGLFENFAPVLMKSKSHEEMAMASPSRDLIADLINQSIPKSVSLDFRLLEENGRRCDDDDAMDFSKFGLGIDDDQPTTTVNNNHATNRKQMSSVDDLLIMNDDDYDQVNNATMQQLKMSGLDDNFIFSSPYSTGKSEYLIFLPSFWS